MSDNTSDGNDKDKNKKDTSTDVIDIRTKQSIKIQDGNSLNQTLGTSYIVGVDPSKLDDDRAPIIVDPVLIDKENKSRDDFVEKQKLTITVKNDGSTTDIINLLLSEIAEELAQLKWERKKAARDGKSTVNLNINRIAGLKTLADLLIKRKESSESERFDFHSPRFQSVFKVWIEFFKESMEKCGIESHIIDLVFQQMKADMIHWEKRMDVGEVK